MKQILLILLCIFVTAIQSEGRLRFEQKMPVFDLSDQYDRPYRPEQPGKTIVLLASDRDGETETVHWRMKINERYHGSVSFIGVADVRGVPFFMKRAVKDNFKKYRAPVLLDWKGELFTAFGLVPGLPNIVVVDKEGILHYLYAGPATEDACSALFSEIDRLLRS